MCKYVFLFALSLTLLSCETPKEIPVTAETALERYLDNGDDQYQWELKESYAIEGQSVTAYDLVLTSQQWREHLWKHQLTVLVPEQLSQEVGLLFITGGSLKDGEPKFKGPDDDLTAGLALIATKNQSLVSILRQTPNQPLYDELVEDQMISFTLHNFKNDGDFTWPLLFPMVKSAVRAMDATQAFASLELQHTLDQFVVTGASKRGWTTWLTGAHDERVVAIAPMVIDVLNMPVSLDYQVEAWQEYSIQIEDYTKLEIPQTVNTESGAQITQMVDPYCYRHKLTMPKMIFIGTIDEYWPVDAIKNYFDSIPGENFIQYVPNAGHDLGDGVQATQALSSFLAITQNGQDYPKCTWDIEENGTNVALAVGASADRLVDALVWSAESADRDFRDETWSSVSLGVQNTDEVEATVDYPASGYKAFYVDLQYTDPHGEAFVQSTRMFVLNDQGVL